jgi:hypothetical protein
MASESAAKQTSAAVCNLTLDQSKTQLAPDHAEGVF